MINQSNASGLKGISRAILTAVISFVVIMAVFATSAFAGLVTQYNVEIKVDNDSVVITTNETEPIEILSQANITLSSSDKLDITDFVSGEGGIIRVDRLNGINIEFDGKINSYSVYADNVGDALKELGINVDSNDKMNYSADDYIKDGMVITIHSAKKVSLTVDGQTSTYAIYQGTVNDLLALAQVTLGADDYTEPSVDAELSENMEVSVMRVEYKELTEKEAVKYITKKNNDPSLAKGTEEVVTQGEDGVVEATYRVKYVNGEAQEKTVLNKTVIKKAVNKVVNVGTKEGAKATGIDADITLQYSARYNVSSNPLTAHKGVVYYNGHKETYYSQRVLPGNALNIPGRHVADDGTVRDGDGYICVAANTSYMSKGTTLMTSLGPAKVYDCGCAYGTIDIYVNW